MKKFWKKVRKILIILLIAQLLYIIILKWIFPPVTLIQLGNFVQGYGLKRDYVEWDDISIEMKLAVMASEDQLFSKHNGFDWKSIEKALEHNEQKPNRIRGASTISQQVAKNVFLWNGRSWTRKGLEAYFTFMIELIWGKQRILEVYLNVSEMGPGIFGAEAAAQNYFNKPASKLNRREAAMIAACLPNPKKYTVKPASRMVTRRYPWIEQQMSNIRSDKDIEALLSIEKKKPAKK